MAECGMVVRSFGQLALVLSASNLSRGLERESGTDIGGRSPNFQYTENCTLAVAAALPSRCVICSLSQRDSFTATRKKNVETRAINT
jgi:hypothetical protein